MKTRLLSVLLLTGFMVFSFNVASAQVGQPDNQVKFEVTKVEFGEIPQGKPVQAEFTFENIGDDPIIILDVQKSCGCTTPSYSKEPIMPGEKSTIIAEYNAKSVGAFNKNITVQMNTENENYMLFLKGEVMEE